ncbi:hypothetical protein [uncultured Desulfosarcina sp.]|uniref:hypothetical protein n=1 Tax=uncultured Desulfosarcina sp. TaxID=218289 RepID=UPI0029C95941|nr:hypothetical protein [uncultured Desulfosarcina sp.]
MHSIKIFSNWVLIFATLFMVTARFDANGFAGEKHAVITDAAIVIDPDQVTPVDFNATIMEIHSENTPPTLIIAEETVLITTYRETGQMESQQTQLLGRSGETLEMSDFTIDQRVIVSGLKQSDDTIIGLQIRIDPEGD